MDLVPGKQVAHRESKVSNIAKALKQKIRNMSTLESSDAEDHHHDMDN